MDTLNKYKRLPENGLTFYETLFRNNTPGAFHTYRAFDLFTIAVSAGLFEWQRTLDSEQYGQWLEAHKPLKSPLQLAEIPHKLVPTESGPIKAQQHLAYWCIRASTYLGLDKVSCTCWEPFEDLFQLPRKTLSRVTKPLELKRDTTTGRIISKRKEYTAEIDAFFDALETALNTDNQ